LYCRTVVKTAIVSDTTIIVQKVTREREAESA